MKKLLSPLIAAFLVLAGCTSDNPDPDPLVYGYDYYPIEVGEYRVYEITEVLNFGDPSLPDYIADTSSFQLRETVDSLFTDEAGKDFFRIFRHRRDNGNDTWREDSVIVIQKTKSQLIKVENNLRTVKLMFPMKENRSWDANMLNADEEDVHSYTSIDKPYTLRRTVNDTTFQQTALVTAEQDSTGVAEVNRFERYARGVGLIESVDETLNYDIGTGLFLQINSRTVKLLQKGRR